MRKIMYLIFVALLAVTLQAAESLKVDFDGEIYGTAGVTETGYEAYVCTHETPASFGPESYNAFDTTVTIEPTWPSGAPAAAMQGINRAFFPAFPYDYTATEGLNLVAEWIGTDTRENPSQPLTLTITGLPAGYFNWVSYHNDVDNQPGEFDVTVNDASGSTVLSGFVQTDNATNLDEVGTCELTIVSNGNDPVSLEFTANSMFFVMNGFELTFDIIRGAAINPVPDGIDPVDSQTTAAVQWSPPLTQSQQEGDPNLVSVEQFDLTYYILDNDQVTDDDPNFLTKGTFDDDVTSPYPVSLTYEQTMFWRIDTHVVWDSNDITGIQNEIIEGQPWQFTTLADDLAPVVTVADVLTALGDLMPAALTGTVDDHEEGDIATVGWELLGTAADAAAMQMIVRGEDLSAVTTDPNLLMDWIGTDTRFDQVGDPLYVTLKGLPSGTYDWLSYHHDAENQNGVFDVTVYDASGTTVTTDVEYYNGNTPPAATLPLTITSNGTDDVVLAFDLQEGDFFVMNGFELDETGGSVDPLYIDFGTVVSETDANAVNVMPGYAVYKARHEVPETFTEQSYSAFGTMVSVLPTWAGVPQAVTFEDTTTHVLSPTATLDSDYPGEYVVQLSATDNIDQTGTDTAIVTVAANACLAAQAGSSWDGFNAYDLDADCDVDIDDLAEFVNDWLDDRNLKAQE